MTKRAAVDPLQSASPPKKLSRSSKPASMLSLTGPRKPSKQRSIQRRKSKYEISSDEDLEEHGLDQANSVLTPPRSSSAEEIFANNEAQSSSARDEIEQAASTTEQQTSDSGEDKAIEQQAQTERLAIQEHSRHAPISPTDESFTDQGQRDTSNTASTSTPTTRQKLTSTEIPFTKLKGIPTTDINVHGEDDEEEEYFMAESNLQTDNATTDPTAEVTSVDMTVEDPPQFSSTLTTEAVIEEVVNEDAIGEDDLKKKLDNTVIPQGAAQEKPAAASKIGNSVSHTTSTLEGWQLDGSSDEARSSAASDSTASTDNPISTVNEDYNQEKQQETTHVASDERESLTITIDNPSDQHNPSSLQDDASETATITAKSDHSTTQRRTSTRTARRARSPLSTRTQSKAPSRRKTSSAKPIPEAEIPYSVKPTSKSYEVTTDVSRQKTQAWGDLPSASVDIAHKAGDLVRVEFSNSDKGYARLCEARQGPQCYLLMQWLYTRADAMQVLEQKKLLKVKKKLMKTWPSDELRVSDHYQLVLLDNLAAQVDVTGLNVGRTILRFSRMAAN
ncbi:hypothetical protein LTR64_002211 [Lithohypha guttulata]|uniref:uncharacterized protein n=1 Tax=Lithohypha guttulata TaxID=1690604 RepID=UPI002DE051DF|nr:hypothetical protein LTR51_001563 [Lithohypha guttulata]